MGWNDQVNSVYTEENRLQFVNSNVRANAKYQLSNIK